ncbi:MAG: hypothetical protein GF341_03235 [candidate division Zixibacteria bacterium]|nr:hypothetical protein [candidate division Zixibacteria bacterium]
MRKTSLILSGLAVALLLVGATVVTSDAQGPNARPSLWADCEYFKSVVTPATFSPDAGNFDELYVNPNGYKDGVNLISESKPGDMDYNGGRWHKNVLKNDVDPDKYSDACTVEDLDLDDFESTDEYFECPVLPRRGKGHSR